MLDPRRVRTKRRELDMSQADLGKTIGKDQAYISKLERGIIAEITVNTLERLAKTLRVTADYLLGMQKEEQR